MLALRFAAGFAALQALDAFGCATCYGASDSPLAAGMNWGIVTLLAFIGMVLAGVAAFFVFLARRASAFAVPDAGSVEAAAGLERGRAGDFLLSRPGTDATEHSVSTSFAASRHARGPGVRPDLN